MKEYRKERSIASVAAFLVFTVFAAAVLITLLGSAGVYERLTKRSTESYDIRTGVRYLTAKVQQAPASVSVEAFGGTDALVFAEHIGDREYATRVYYHNGWLMELFSAREGAFSPEDGEKLLPARSLQMVLENGLLTLELTDGHGQTRELILALPTERGAQP